MSEKGHILLHRQLIDSEVFANQTALKIWIWLLFKASYKERFVPLKIGNGITTVSLKRGQLLFGRFKAEEALNIDGSTIYKWIHKMQDSGMIKIESNSHSTIISIEKYDIYQTIDEEKEQPSNNQVTTEEQPSNNRVTQIMNIKKVNKDNKVKQVLPSRADLIKIFKNTAKEIFNEKQITLNEFHCEEKAEEFCDFWIGNSDFPGEWYTNKKYYKRIINPKSTIKNNIIKYNFDYMANYDIPYDPEPEKTPEQIAEQKKRDAEILEKFRAKMQKREVESGITN